MKGWMQILRHHVEHNKEQTCVGCNISLAAYLVQDDGHQNHHLQDKDRHHLYFVHPDNKLEEIKAWRVDSFCISSCFSSSLRNHLDHPGHHHQRNNFLFLLSSHHHHDQDFPEGVALFLSVLPLVLSVSFTHTLFSPATFFSSLFSFLSLVTQRLWLLLPLKVLWCSQLLHRMWGRDVAHNQWKRKKEQPISRAILSINCILLCLLSVFSLLLFYWKLVSMIRFLRTLSLF